MSSLFRRRNSPVDEVDRFLHSMTHFTDDASVELIEFLNLVVADPQKIVDMIDSKTARLDNNEKLLVGNLSQAIRSTFFSEKGRQRTGEGFKNVNLAQLAGSLYHNLGNTLSTIGNGSKKFRFDRGGLVSAYNVVGASLSDIGDSTKNPDKLARDVAIVAHNSGPLQRQIAEQGNTGFTL